MASGTSCGPGVSTSRISTSGVCYIVVAEVVGSGLDRHYTREDELGEGPLDIEAAEGELLGQA